MLKKYKGTLIVTTLVMLVPMLVGLILWDKLPEQMPTHFNAAGEVDGWSSKPFAVFGLPGIILALHWVCVLGSLKGDPKAYNLNGKMLGLVFWICPVISILCGVLLTYGTALGLEINVTLVMPVFVGLVMVIVGNWLPKCKQTWTMGIKLPWTLSDEDNWNRTHRFAGPVWVVCGLLIMACGMIGGALLWVLIPALAVMVLAPTVYSYLLFKGHIK